MYVGGGSCLSCPSFQERLAVIRVGLLIGWPYDKRLVWFGLTQLPGFALRLIFSRTQGPRGDTLTTWPLLIARGLTAEFQAG